MKWKLCLFVIVGAGIYLLFRTPHQNDFSNLPAFATKQSRFIPVKICGFSIGNIPQLEIEIEGQVFTADLDLGWDGGVVLPVDMIQKINNKLLAGQHSFFNLQGKTYQSSVYEVSAIHLGKARIFPIKVEEAHPVFETDGILIKDAKDVTESSNGRVGWRIFRNLNILLDCEHNLLIFSDSLQTLKQQGYPIDSFIEAPLLLDRNSIDFEVITQDGPLRCMLDTGSTLNLLNIDLKNGDQSHRLIDLDHLKDKPPEFNSDNQDLLIFNKQDNWECKMFELSGNEFGPVHFNKIKSPVGIDAIIGMEFIEDHLIFIDFQNQKIYFSKLPEERSLMNRAYDSFAEVVSKCYKK